MHAPFCEFYAQLPGRANGIYPIRLDLDDRCTLHANRYGHVNGVLSIAFWWGHVPQQSTESTGPIGPSEPARKFAKPAQWIEWPNRAPWPNGPAWVQHEPMGPLGSSMSQWAPWALGPDRPGPTPKLQELLLNMTKQTCPTHRYGANRRTKEKGCV